MLRHNLSSYGITGRVFSMIKSFLASSSLKVVAKGQFSGTIAINADDSYQLVGLLYINDLVKCILRSFVNIHTDDTAVDGCTSKTLDKQRFEADPLL